MVTEVQDVITQCLQLLQEYGHINKDLTLREAYNQTIHPDVLPVEDDKLWQSIRSGKILKLFQFETTIGQTTVRELKPKTPVEMSNCNCLMRLMAEKGEERPADRYHRLQNNIQEWYQEMNDRGLSKEEQSIMEEYCSDCFGTPSTQEALMLVLMDKRVCGFSLSESNKARKLVAKKKMEEIPKLKKKIFDTAPNENFGSYIWDIFAKPQLGYSFSSIHSLLYSYIGLQTAFLATYFPKVYWNTACLRVDAGLEEETSTNYDKISKAVGNMIYRGIDVKTVDINKSKYMFEPDEEHNTILFGLKGVTSANGEFIRDLVSNRPYSSPKDFLDRMNPSKTMMINLIKAGAFDEFDNRQELMKKYLRETSGQKKRITLQNFNGLQEADLIPPVLEFEQRVWNFNKALKKYMKYNKQYFKLEGSFYTFYRENFDEDFIRVIDGIPCIDKKTWKSLYDEQMVTVKDYFKKHQDELLNALNDSLFQEEYDKYALGSISTWEMKSLGYYSHDHELSRVNKNLYDIVPYSILQEDPVVDYVIKRKGREIPIFKTFRIIGTVVGKNIVKSQVNILTPDSGVVTVKMSRDYFARYNRRISSPDESGVNRVREEGWFKRGNLIMVNGFKRGGMFVTKTYKNTPSHQLYLITNVNNEDGSMSFTNSRWGEE